MASKFYTISWWIVLALFKIFLRLKVEGKENVPEEGGVILASNHASYIDPPVVGVSTKREMKFLAKRELFEPPVFGTIITKLNAVPINRSGFGKEPLDAMYKALEEDMAVIVFPEGTRNKGRYLGKAKAGLGMIALRSSKPIVPVHISGTRSVWRSLIGIERVKVSFGKLINLDEIPLSGNRKDDYRTVTQEVMREIEKLKAFQGKVKQ